MNINEVIRVLDRDDIDKMKKMFNWIDFDSVLKYGTKLLLESIEARCLETTRLLLHTYLNKLNNMFSEDNKEYPVQFSNKDYCEIIIDEIDKAIKETLNYVCADGNHPVFSWSKIKAEVNVIRRANLIDELELKVKDSGSLHIMLSMNKGIFKLFRYTEESIKFYDLKMKERPNYLHLALNEANLNESYKVASLLIRYGIDLKSALPLAIKNGRFDIANLIIEHKIREYDFEELDTDDKVKQINLDLLKYSKEHSNRLMKEIMKNDKEYLKQKLMNLWTYKNKLVINILNLNNLRVDFEKLTHVSAGR